MFVYNRLDVCCQTGCITGLTTGLTNSHCSFNRLSRRFDNRLYVCIHDTTGCQTGLTTGLTTGVWQQVVSCKRDFSGPKFTILWGHVEERRYCCLAIFPIVDACLSCEDTARQSCAMVPRWRFFGDFLHPVFAASRVQYTYISDLHSKFALRPHHVWKYGRHRSCLQHNAVMDYS